MQQNLNVNSKISKKNNCVVIFKILVYFTVMTGLLICLTGCYYSKEEKEYMKQLRNQASENALKYIKSKYSFSPKIISVDNIIHDDTIFGTVAGDISDDVYVEMKHNNKIFTVVISGEKDNLLGYDNYQYNEILEDVINEINSKINLKPHKVNLSYWGWNRQFPENSKKGRYGLINEKYNGTDIKNFINELSELTIIVEYINEKNLQFIKEENLLEGFNNMHIILINYNSQSDFDSLSNRDSLFKERESFREDFIDINKDKIESALTRYTYDDGKTINFNYYKNGEKVN